MLWGVFYMIILLAEKQLLGKWIAKLPKWLSWIYMFIIVNFGWLLFRVNTLDDLGYVLNSFFHPSGTTADFLASNFSIMPYVNFMIIGLIFMFPVGKRSSGWLLKKKCGRLVLDLILIVLFVIGVCALVNSSYNPFIYFRF